MSSSSQQPTRLDVEIEADEVDSTLGDDLSTYTESIKSTLFQSVVENGRGYHKFRDGQYILPEDEFEQERLDMQHAMFLRSFGGKLFLAPIERTMQDVLDLGTGTGSWAIDFADQHPQSNVLGVDLSPIQPMSVPPNCKFEVDDFDNPWTYNKKFDFIHGRMLLTASADFPKLFGQVFDSLKPGGWFEMQDLYMPILCDDGTMKGTAWQEWNDKYMEACSIIKRDPSWTAKYQEWMVAAGFTHVKQDLFKWPVNPWPKDKSLKEMGLWNMINMLDGLDGFTVRLWTTALGMTPEEIQLFLVQVRKDLKNTKIHSYWPIYVVYGQKPE
ncbi:uncharacterized protein Z518_03420 [Rhinocladiella mackenziei CBS 650.93]|uniref:Rhinocladiella mackenziei CBS 650.93 unplaced genomic scaffold supercont1.2, whole genome shotgun sequence n=1 Tax=Rhinocladiella mackenziei CBS 650.93 TaxID=1442369 RepID=A0A0D2HDX1_9EURO|nr:uncharacterized protein Z518_03420 [Rhinocladiella mackenziei CBS 650.93]KIX08763.1 hypothetical protein Z518_03420 [Rhinocladiella mackenziei CBS 650.93]